MLLKKFYLRNKKENRNLPLFYQKQIMKFIIKNYLLLWKS